MVIEEREIEVVSRNLAVIALFSERFDSLVERDCSAEDSALRVATSVLNGLKPYVVKAAAAELDELATHYET